MEFIEIISRINPWAILVAGTGAFVLGGLWYSPALFEHSWQQANGYSSAQVEQIQTALGAPGFAATAAAYVLMAAAMALLLALMPAAGWKMGLLLAVLIWLGFVATSALTTNLFSTRPLSAWGIDAAFQLLALAVIGLIVGLWRA